MMRVLLLTRLGAAFALFLAMRPGVPAAAQGFGVERIFPESQDAVEKALDQIRPTAKGRLPTLDGFVGATDQPLERYKSGYYDCSIKVSRDSSGGTLVRVTAKITAWFTDSNPARSGYRTLPSNGRLETDLLDRLAESLEPTGTQGTTGNPPKDLTPSSPRSTPAVPLRPPDSVLPDRLTSGGAPAPLPAAAGAGRAATPATAGAPTNQPAATDAERAQAEEHARELSTLAQNLEEILRNQSHPENLAAVSKSGTPVYAKPQPGAQVLFSAEAQDEFQILEVQRNWVHVQISGASRGWIRRVQLELPQGFGEAPAKAADSGPAGNVSFRVTRETLSRFTGNWEPLRGKMVKVFDVEPDAGMATSGTEKRKFAKTLLAGAHTDTAPGAASLAGVVVVFDSADGGQISLTLADLKLFQEGRITDAALWQRCSLDPPEAFQDSGKP